MIATLGYRRGLLPTEACDDTRLDSTHARTHARTTLHRSPRRRVGDQHHTCLSPSLCSTLSIQTGEAATITGPQANDETTNHQTTHHHKDKPHRLEEVTAIMPSYFLSSFIAAFRQQPPNHTPQPGPSKHTTTSTNSTSTSQTTQSSSQAHAASSPPSAAAHGQSAITAATAAAANHHRHGVTLHSPRGGHHSANPTPNGSANGIPIPGGGGRRRGSDSSSEGFRDVLGADKWYIGGRTAGGEEQFFKLGVVRRVRSNDGLSLDRLSL